VNEPWRTEGQGCCGDIAACGLRPGSGSLRGPQTFELPPNPHVSAMAEVGAIFGDPARVRMLCRLAEGVPLSARALADCAGVTPQTASGHIAKLVAASLVAVERQGRERKHRLASPAAAELLTLIHRVGLMARRDQVRPVIAPDPSSRLARTCYDHVGGRLGYRITNALTEVRDGDVRLRPRYLGELESWGVPAPSSSDGATPCATCREWPDVTIHLGGSLGAAILSRSLELDWIRPRPGSRALTITHLGSSGFRKIFGLRPD
jgi:DNA-binding transcriptional ArsR family regulator